MILSKSADELYVYMDVGRYASKHIFRWARDQEWPPGTELEDFNDYHVTLLYCPYGYQTFHKASWVNPDIEKTEVTVTGFENFGPDEDGRFAYVLILDGPEIRDLGEKLQKIAASMGIIDTHFGSYTPHVTIGYGPYPVIWTSLPGITMDIGPSTVGQPRVRDSFITSGLNEHFFHYHPFTGLPCNCFWGNYRERHKHRLAGQNLNQAIKVHRKWLESPEGEKALEYLTEHLPPEYDSLAPYIAQHMRKGDVYLHDYGNGPELLYSTPDGIRKEINLPKWHQWFEARQHPTRRGINVMDKTFSPVNFAAQVDKHQQDLQDREKRNRWIKRYAPSANIVHNFGPEAGKYNGWKVAHLDREQAEGESEALSHCIGRDDQPYRHNIDQGIIDAYSLRDREGYPHVTWHINPSGETIGHMQGKSGYPNEEYRNLISLFNKTKGLPDEESDYEEELEPERWGRYELPEAANQYEYVNGVDVPYDDEEFVGPDTEITAGPPDWDAIAEDYLTGGPETGFLKALRERGHGALFGDRLRNYYQGEYLDNPDARMAIRDFNSQRLAPEIPVQNKVGGMEEYTHTVTPHTEHLYDINWRDIAHDYVANHNYLPVHRQNFMTALDQNDPYHKVMMQSTLQNMTPRPELDSAINLWNETYPEHNIQQHNPNQMSLFSRIGNQLHRASSAGAGLSSIVATARQMLQSARYPDDDLSVQAALEAWQALYPSDQVQAESLLVTSMWDYDSEFEHLVDKYSPYGLSCLYDESPETVDISHIEVDPRQRNQGIGSRFMREAYDYAQKNGKQLQVSRVDNVPFFSKFPFLEQADDKRFVTAAWDGAIPGYSGSPSAAQHSAQAPMPYDSELLSRPLDNLSPNPYAGVHQSLIQEGDPQLYVKPESVSDFHNDSPIRERAAYVLGHAMGINVPPAVVRRASVPLQNRDGRRDAYISVHAGIPDAQTIGAHLADQDIFEASSEGKDFMDANVEKRRQLALLDQVIGNPDRHTENVLINNKGEWIPIDHGGAFGPTGLIRDWGFNYQDFNDQPLTPEELARVQQAADAMRDPRHQKLFERSELNPEYLRQRIDYLLQNKAFIPARG